MRALLLLVLMSTALVVRSDADYRLEVTYELTGEVICAHFRFDTLKSCEDAKTWFEQQAKWHGKNKFKCIHASRCPYEDEEL